MITEPEDSRIAEGDLLRDAGDLNGALAKYREILQSTPGNAKAHYKLGVALTRAGHAAEAEASYRMALRHEPGYPEAANNLGLLLDNKGSSHEAEALYRTALVARIDYFEAHLNLGELLFRTQRRDEAWYHYLRAVHLQPTSAPAQVQLGELLYDAGLMLKARAAFEEALNLDPQNAIAWAHLARCHMSAGDMDGSDACNQKAIALLPTLVSARQNYVMSVNYRTCDKEAAFRRHVEFGQYLCSQGAHEPQHRFSNSGKPTRRLRIGFVSGDFRRHSVSHFIEAPLKALGRDQFELWAYYTFPREDFRTIELKPLFTEWRDIHAFSDSEATALIRRDRIDILVDLSGITGNSRLGIFAAKAAPIQVTWIGYPNTTGLPTMDYRITDELADPEGSDDGYHTEKLVRIPDCFLCYSPPNDAPAVTPPPVLSGKSLCFGSFNGRLKIGQETLSLWSRVLTAVPNSRLVVKSIGTYDTQEGRDEMLQQMAEAGIDTTRVSLHRGERTLAMHLALYEQIDIALDTYPYHGTTTTCEALWMGVPVVTLAGDCHAARVGASLLTNLGLQDLVAADADDYVRIAKNLAASRDRLADLRTGMRRRMQDSPLLNGQAMAEKLAQAFRKMWRNYCDDNPKSNAEADAIEQNRRVVNMQGGYRLCLAANAKTSLSTWIALEQEDWFEDEIRFVRDLCTPSWQALDIGANHGIYALSLASCGASRIWAFEPTSEPRLRFRDSITLNGFENRIHVFPCGLSSVAQSINITLSQHSELNSIHTASGNALGEEAISLLPLDGLIGTEIPESANIDFVKLDAEGEEVAILRGGLRFFCAQSPLVMFEYKHGNSVNTELLVTLRAIGYGIFRLLPALGCLVPVAPGEEAELPAFTLNLFACKADKANALETEGRLLQSLPSTTVPLHSEWIQELLRLPAVVGKTATWNDYALDSDYGRALIAWCGSRSRAISKRDRYQLLIQSFEYIQTALANEDTHPAVAVLCIRVCSDIGLRAPALQVGYEFMEQMTPDEEFPLDRPLPPAYEAFDVRPICTSLGNFIYQSIVEFLIDRGAFSTFFLAPKDWLLARGLSSSERTPRIERIAVLLAEGSGDALPIGTTARLSCQANDNLNPEIWRSLVDQGEAKLAAL